MVVCVLLKRTLIPLIAGFPCEGEGTGADIVQSGSVPPKNRIIVGVQCSVMMVDLCAAFDMGLPI